MIGNHILCGFRQVSRTVYVYISSSRIPIGTFGTPDKSKLKNHGMQNYTQIFNLISPMYQKGDKVVFKSKRSTLT